MSLNHREIDLVLEELALEGAQIQKVIQSSWDVLCLCLYGRPGSGTGGARATSLLITLTPGSTRLHATFRAVPKSDKPLRFCEFLRAHIRDGYIEEAVQLGGDRIVRLTIRRGEQRSFLYLRLWTNAANVILTDEGHTILDALKRSPRRGEMAGSRYEPEAELAAPDTLAAPDSLPAAGHPAKKPRAPKVYEVRELPGEGSFNEKLDAWYAEHAGQASLEALREQVAKQWGMRKNRLCAAIESLEHKLDAYRKCEEIKHHGDLIMASLGSASPQGEWLEVNDYESGATVRIGIDSSKTLPENAQLLYERYRKEKRALDDIERDLAGSRQELEELCREEAALLAEENPLRLQKALRHKQAIVSKQVDKARPGISYRRNDWLIIVGRTGKENDELLRRHVRGSDLWLHARDWPGAYVFIKARAGKSVPLDILLDAGTLALFYSKARSSVEADLYYTHVKYLRRAKNGPVGLVLPTQEKNLRVRIDDERLRELEKCRDQA